MTYRFTKNATDESKLTCVWSHFEGGCMKKICLHRFWLLIILSAHFGNVFICYKTLHQKKSNFSGVEWF